MITLIRSVLTLGVGVSVRWSTGIYGICVCVLMWSCDQALQSEERYQAYKQHDLIEKLRQKILNSQQPSNLENNPDNPDNSNNPNNPNNSNNPSKNSNDNEKSYFKNHLSISNKFESGIGIDESKSVGVGIKHIIPAVVPLSINNQNNDINSVNSLNITTGPDDMNTKHENGGNLNLNRNENENGDEEIHDTNERLSQIEREKIEKDSFKLGHYALDLDDLGPLDRYIYI